MNVTGKKIRPHFRYLAPTAGWLLIGDRRNTVTATPAAREAPAARPTFQFAPDLIPYLARAPVQQRKAAIGDLNARVGNRRVALTIRNALAIQRDAQFGMMKKDQVTGFAGLVLAHWRANPDKTLADFGTHLMNQLNVQLAANGVPKLPAPNLSSKRSAGGFAASSWTVQFDLRGRVNRNARPVRLVQYRTIGRSHLTSADR